MTSVSRRHLQLFFFFCTCARKDFKNLCVDCYAAVFVGVQERLCFQSKHEKRQSKSDPFGFKTDLQSLRMNAGEGCGIRLTPR